MPIIIDERTNSKQPVANLKPNTVFCTAEHPNVRYLLTSKIDKNERIVVDLETGDLGSMDPAVNVIALDATITIKK